MYTKPFYIVVNPTGSKFAKTLQSALRATVTNSIYRRLTPRQLRNNFIVTTTTLDKIQQLTRFKEHNVPHPSFETDRSRLRDTGKQIWFARTLIKATNGRGIVEFDLRSERDIPVAPLYTEYIPKRAEYRFHVFNGNVIDVQEKRKKRDFGDGRNTRVRNVNNGYVYCRDAVNPPDGAADIAVRAVQAVGYQYGAVDLIYNEHRNQCYVLEVNSRPGLMGTTIDKYVEALINQYDLRRK
jgi:hypothetical protein